MVARQMREQQRMEQDAPDETWTQAETELYELQRLSRATFKVKTNLWIPGYNAGCYILV